MPLSKRELIRDPDLRQAYNQEDPGIELKVQNLFKQLQREGFSFAVLKQLYFLQFTSSLHLLPPDQYHELVSVYRDIALLKARHMRNTELFTFLLQKTRQSLV